MEALRIVDRFDGGLGWAADELLARTSHALAVDGRVWLIDPVEPDDDVLLEVASLGEPAGVLQLLDRHSRDCARVATRLGVPHLSVFSGRAAECPFELVPIAGRRWWREVALWWAEPRVLVCGDALGTVGYFVASHERIGVHPLLRPFPPRRLRPLDPARILVGHGEGIHEDAGPALREALATARRRAPAALVGAVRRAVSRRHV